jgi:splicing factor 3A subunit 2
VAAEPYETVAFKIPNIEIDFGTGKFFESWDKEQKKYTLQLFFVD